MSEPAENYFQLKKGEVKVHFISSPADISLASRLKDMKILGVDTEWCPSFGFEQPSVALLQIGNLEEVFLFDMVSLKSNQELDELLKEVFNTCLIVGMAFGNDLRMIKAEGFSFGNQISKFVEITTLFAKVFPENKERSLAKICKTVLGVEICKFEQMSNWQN